ncbi:hypothetical protein Tco_0442649 [Tanacetum coccineum]
MERGFLSQKGSRVGRGIKEKNVSDSNIKVVKDHVVPSVIVATGNTREENIGQSSTGPTTSQSGPDVLFASLLKESIRVVSERYANSSYGFFLGKRNPDVNLMKEDVVNVSVWVKLHGVHVTAFTEDGLSVIAMKIELIEIQADVELKDTIVVAMPKLTGDGFYTCTVHVEYEWKPPSKKYRPDSKKPTANPSGNTKKGVEPTKEVSNSNPFDVLNSVDNDVELGTNGYCPPSKTAKQLEKIRNFKQEEDETLYQAWERYNDLLYKCPTHDINSHQKTMADHSQKWHDGSFSRNKESSSNSEGIAAIVNKLENLGRDMKKLKENVHAIQVGCQICGGAHLDKDFPLNEEVKSVKEVRTLSNEVEGQANNGKFKECKTICTKDGSPLYTPFYYYSEESEYFSANSGFLNDEKQETDNLRMAEALAALEATLKKKRRT